MDKISVIIPIYNASKYLCRCLDSVINQSYQNLEIICINDGSTDNSGEILNSYSKKDERLIIINNKNEGVSKTRNCGIKKATGKYITFVDADDYIEKDEIELMYNAIVSNKVDVVRINYVVNYTNSVKKDYGDLREFSNRKLNRKEIRTGFLDKLLDGSIPCFVYLLLIDKNILMKTKKFPIDIHMMEDVVFYIDLMLSINSLYVLDKPLYNIYFNEDGATNSPKNYERNIFNIVEVNSYIKKILYDRKLDDDNKIKRLNTANVIAISDFIFRQYLAGYDAIYVCRKLSENKKMYDILDNVDYSVINIQRKIILKAIRRKKIDCLIIYFRLRKFIYNLKRG